MMSRIPTHLEPESELAYAGSTNTEQNGRKDKINSITNEKYLTFYIHNINTRGITMKEYANISHCGIIHILFHGQAVCREGTKYKKACLTSIGNITMWLYYSLARFDCLKFRFLFLMLYKPS